MKKIITNSFGKKFRLNIIENKPNYKYIIIDSETEHNFETEITYEKLHFRILYALESKNDYKYKLENYEKKIIITISSPHTEDDNIELFLIENKTNNELYKIEKAYKLLLSPMLKKICIPNQNHNFDDTKETKIFFKKLESYLLIHNKDYQSITEKIKYENYSIKNKYFEMTINRLPDEILKPISYLAYSVSSNYTKCTYLKLRNLLIETKNLECKHSTPKNICHTCILSLKLPLDTPCINITNRGFNSVIYCNIDHDKRRISFEAPEKTKYIDRKNCNQEMINDMNNLLFHKYYDLVWNYLSYTGYHTIDFEEKNKFVKCIKNETKQYNYSTIIAYEIGDKYYDIITCKEISIDEDNICYFSNIGKINSNQISYSPDIYCHNVSKCILIFREEI